VSRVPGLRAQLRERLLEQRELGEDGLPRVAPRARRAPAASPARGEAAREPAPRVAAAGGSSDDAWSALDLAGLGTFLADCARCKLCSGRTKVVFGSGDVSARLVFVGEGPGADEDLQGLPFVGRAGQLLTDMIEKGMGLRRDDVYIANVVKCRPPGNRNPEPDEIAACSPFLRRQIALVRPDAIVTLGKFAAQSLLKSEEPIGKLRGRWHDYEGTPLMPTFHPAYLLRSPDQKRFAWADLKLVMERLGLRR
jgi:uracil-DNA glycosylase family 4